MPIYGSPTCGTCATDPRFRLLPCQHTVCQYHAAQAKDDKISSVETCGFCDQTAACVFEIPAFTGRSPISPIVETIWSPLRGSRSNTPVMGLSNSGWRNPSFAPNTQAQQYQVPFAAPQLHSPQPQSAGFGSHAMRQGNTSAMNHTQPFAHASGFARGHNIPNLHINTSEIIPAQVHSDPFVDNSSTTAVNAWRQNTQNAVSPSGPFTSPRNNGGLSQEYRTHAKALANYIKSGALEQQDTSPPRSQTASQALLVARTPAPALRLERVPNPPFLKRALKQGILPSFDDAIKHVPFVEPGRRVQPSTLGCVVIRNIPYSTAKAEIVAALGRNARLSAQPAGSPYYAIHIIMERSTGKTMDCYVEVDSASEASLIVKHYEHRLLDRPTRIGDRMVYIEMCGQAELMKALFPRAKCVSWDGQMPVVRESDGLWSSGFRGFMTNEEMIMCVKHAETPQRSPFAARNPSRIYESLISTLHKYPWHATSHISIRERATLFNTTCASISALMAALRRRGGHAGAAHAGLGHPATMNQYKKPAAHTAPHAHPSLAPGLLHELVTAALLATGWSTMQRGALARLVLAGGYGHLVRDVVGGDGLGVGASVGLGTSAGGFGVSAEIEGFWPFESLVQKPEVSQETVEFYVGLSRRGAATGATAGGVAGVGQNPFGDLRVDYNVPDPAAMGELSVEECAKREWDVVEGCLRKVLGASKSELALLGAAAAASAGAGAEREYGGGGGGGGASHYNDGAWMKSERNLTIG